MSDPFDKPIVSPFMVGREAQTTALLERLAEASAGVGQVVLISGEAGIGKSRLVAEAMASAFERGMHVLTGNCFEPDRALPYAPLRDLFRSELPRLVDTVNELPPEIGQLLPELTPGAPGAVQGAWHDTRQMVHAVGRVLARIAEQAPVLLVIEDAHWSDEASLDLMIGLARFVRRTIIPLAIFVTYRGDEVSPALAATLAAFDRERLAIELRLGPLPRPEVAAMLRAMTERHAQLSAETSEAIFRLSEGNPFFVEELLRSAIASDEHSAPTSGIGASIPLPRSVAEAVRRRVDQLSGGARETLTIAAISGRRFDFALILALSGGDEVRVLGHLKELIAARLIVEERPDRFAFRHALTRQAVDDGLLARERKALHRRALDAIQRSEPRARELRAADLARHALGAGVWSDVLDFGRVAGEQALALHAPGAAVDLLGHALEAAGRLGVEPPAALLRARGLAHESLGHFDAARADYAAAIALAHAAQDWREEIEALLALGGLWAARDYKQTAVLVRQAVSLARSAGDRPVIARSLNRLANWHANHEQTIEAMRLHEEALEIVEQSGERRGIAETLDLLGMARYLHGDFIGAAAALRRAIPILRELDDRRTLINTLAALSITLTGFDATIAIPADDHDNERFTFADEAIAVAQAIGARPDEALAHCCAALVTAERRLDTALDHARSALRIAEEIGHHQWVIFARLVLSELARVSFDPDEACAQLDAALTTAREVGSTFWMREIAAYSTIQCVHAGDLDGAAATLSEVMDENLPMNGLDQRDAWWSYAELMLARGDAGGALSIVDRLIDAATDDPGADLIRLPGLALLRGQCLDRLDRTADAMEALAAARDGAAKRVDYPLLWRIALARATILRTRGCRAEAASQLAAAHEAAAVYAAGIKNAALRETFLGRISRNLPPLPTPTPRQAAKAAFDGLTRRERDVAALVAGGKSNREIGEALFMSERTAATHVGNILGKLEVKTRAQIAAWAQERGLAIEPTDSH